MYILGRDIKDISQTAESLNAKPIVCDITKPEDISKIVSQIDETGLDLLVNNAGISNPKPISEITYDDFYESFNTNVRGPLFLIKELIPFLSKQKGYASYRVNIRQQCIPY